MSSQAGAEKAVTTAQNPDNTLLGCLVWLTAHYGHARSAAVLQAGLPIDPKGMSPQIFCEAAARAGLAARIVKRQPREMPAGVLPAVILTSGGGGLLYLSETNDVAQVIDMAKGETPVALSLNELTARSNGYVIYTRPAKLTVADDDAAPLSSHWFWQTVLENRGIYIQVAVATLFINIFALASPIFMMNFYNRVLPNDATETGWVLAIGVLSVFVFDFVIKTLRGYFIDVAGRRSDVVTGQKLYDQVLDVKLGQRRDSIGAFANMLREFDSVRDFFTSATMTAMVDLPFSLLFIVAIWLVASPSMALVLLLVYLIAIAAGWLAQIPVRRAVREAMHTAEKKHGLLVETIATHETIRGIGGEGPLRARYRRYLAAAAEAGQVSRYYSGLSVNFSLLLQAASAVLMVMIGMYLVRDRDMTAGALIASAMLAGRAISPVGMVAGLVNRYHQAKASYRRLDGLMHQQVERPIERNFLHRPQLAGGFALQGVDFAYPDNTHKVLSGVNLMINPGERVAVVGRIGSGKTTLIKLLVNFYSPTAGAVLADGTDMRQIDPADLRRQIAYMGQDTTLLSGTLRENITLGNPAASDADVLRVAELTGVHEFVRRHPQGYDAPVGEGGQGLSGGQRQAVALARTLLRDTPVLILDEPTNAMDGGSEERLLRLLEKHVIGKTLVLVTHKPALLRLVERLIVVDNGRIVMDGPKDQVWTALAQGQVAVTTPGASL